MFQAENLKVHGGISDELRLGRVQLGDPLSAGSDQRRRPDAQSIELSAFYFDLQG